MGSFFFSLRDAGVRNRATRIVPDSVRVSKDICSVKMVAIFLSASPPPVI